MNNAVFGKTMKSIGTCHNRKKKRNCLLSEPNYHTTKSYTEHLLAIEMKKKTDIIMNKPAYLGLSILELSNMYEFYYDYLKPKYGKKAKLTIC